jgi:UDPglucose--hexose-1-phosphate uridylyltransferase
MPELRRDPIVDRWVIIAKNRAARPNEYEPPSPVRSDKPCPFCEGNESLAPAEVFSYRANGTEPHEPGWRVRVVPNKYPAFRSLGGEDNFGDHGSEFESRVPAVGTHEVIIESPRHVVSTTDLSEEELAEVLSAYRERLLAIQRDPRIKHGLIFKNVGPAAGASIEHTHSQLIGTTTVPGLIAEELAASRAFYEKRGRCIFCDVLARELAEQTRIVVDTPGFVAFCPFASRFPFEMWLLPRQHASHFESLCSAEIAELAKSLRRCIGNIERISGRAHYNYLIHSAPFDTGPQSHYHWHIEIFPRMTTTAGFEWATGQFINPVPPEEAAETLRQQ